MNTDPFHPDAQFEGRLRGKQVPDGSSEAMLSVDNEGIHAVPRFGAAHTIPLKGLRLRRDESSALIATQAGGKWSVSCSDPEFFRVLETVAGNHLNDELSRLSGDTVSSKGKHWFGCFLVLAICGGILWAIPKVFHKSISATVEALPTSVDETIGEAAQDSMDPGGKVIEDEEILEPLQAILDRLTPYAELEGIEYQFRVVRSEVSNAYALPGGYITIFTGLIQESETPEQVAGVIAHEIAHVQQRHGLRRVAHQLGMIAGVSVIFGNLGGIEKLAVELFTLTQVNGYSQDQETEADLEGLRILIGAKINPSGLSEFFEKMHAKYGDTPDAMSWASTHPQFKVRIATIQAKLAESQSLPEWEPIDIDWPALQEALDR